MFQKYFVVYIAIHIYEFWMRQKAKEDFLKFHSVSLASLFQSMKTNNYVF